MNTKRDFSMYHSVGFKLHKERDKKLVNLLGKEVKQHRGDVTDMFRHILTKFFKV